MNSGQTSLRAALIVLVIVAGVGDAHAASPEEVLKTYLAAIYARNLRVAYTLISAEERKLKTENEYLRENPPLEGAALEVATRLATHIRYEHLRTVTDGDHVTITFTATVPNANDPAIDGLVLGFEDRRLAALSPAEQKNAMDKLDGLAKTGRLPILVGENERWTLVKEKGTWRVFLAWADAILVRFSGEVKAGLPWTFKPIQPVVRAKPGETLDTFYLVTNLSDQEMSAKARDVLRPPEAARYLQIVTCFCFIQQTLKAGESRKLPVAFRVSVRVPQLIREIGIHYEFHPIDRFPLVRGR